MRIYIDTSVFGGAFDDEFKEASNLFFEEIRRGKFTPVISAVVADEIKLAPEKVKKTI